MKPALLSHNFMLQNIDMISKSWRFVTKNHSAFLHTFIFLNLNNCFKFNNISQKYIKGLLFIFEDVHDSLEIKLLSFEVIIFSKISSRMSKSQKYLLHVHTSKSVLLNYAFKKRSKWVALTII